MNLNLKTILATALLSAPVLSQAGSVNVPDDGTKVVVAAQQSDKSVGITVNPGADTTVKIMVKNAAGAVQTTYELDGAGDGTGVFVLPAGWTVEAEDEDDGDADKPQVAYDVRAA